MSKRLVFLRLLLFISFVLLLFSLTGCSTYQTITGYFNTYYNAKKIFDEAVNDLQKASKRDIDSAYFVEYNASEQIIKKFDKVIEKCSKLIQFYPQSGLVDDALLLIGKSYAYCDEHESAIRKFQELLDNFPNSDLSLEAKLWYAKSEYLFYNEQLARQLIRQLVPQAQQEGKSDIAIEAYMLEGQILYLNGEYAPAAEAYSQALTYSGGDGYLLALSAYYLGKCNEQLQRFENAAQNYNKVLEYDPDQKLKFRASVNCGRMLVASKQFDQALETFSKLRDDAVKPEEQAEVELEIATTHIAIGDTAQAFNVFRHIDTTYKRTDATAKGYYRRGILYEKTYNDFQSAYRYYLSAKSEFPNSPITPLAKKKVNNLERYFQRHKNLTRYDSLLSLALQPDSLKDKLPGQDSLRAVDSTIVAQKTESIKKETDTLTHIARGIVDDATEKEESLDVKYADMAESREREVSDEPDTADEEEVEDTKEPELREEQRHRRIMDERRMRRDVQPDTMQSRRPQIRMPQFTPDTLRYLINQERLELASLQYMEMDLVDSAFYWYEKIVQDSIETSFKPHAMYALAEIYSSKGDTMKADSLYKTLLESYGETEFGKHIKKSLGLEVEKVEIDSGFVMYQNAQQLLLDGKTEQALQMFQLIPAMNPLSKSVPQALYAVGWIYENIFVNNDSAAAWYNRLISEYPNSVYAAEVQPKVAVKEKPESLNQYVKIKEIPLLSKQAVSDRTRTTATTPAGIRDERQPTRERGRGKDIEEEEEEEEPEKEEDWEEDDE